MDVSCLQLQEHAVSVDRDPILHLNLAVSIRASSILHIAQDMTLDASDEEFAISKAKMMLTMETSQGGSRGLGRFTDPIPRPTAQLLLFCHSLISKQDDPGSSSSSTTSTSPSKQLLQAALTRCAGFFTSAGYEWPNYRILAAALGAVHAPELQYHPMVHNLQWQYCTQLAMAFAEQQQLAQHASNIIPALVPWHLALLDASQKVAERTGWESFVTGPVALVLACSASCNRLARQSKPEDSSSNHTNIRCLAWALAGTSYVLSICWQMHSEISEDPSANPPHHGDSSQGMLPSSIRTSVGALCRARDSLATTLASALRHATAIAKASNAAPDQLLTQASVNALIITAQSGAMNLATGSRPTAFTSSLDDANVAQLVDRREMTQLENLELNSFARLFRLAGMSAPGTGEPQASRILGLLATSCKSVPWFAAEIGLHPSTPTLAALEVE